MKVDCTQAHLNEGGQITCAIAVESHTPDADTSRTVSTGCEAIQLVRELQQQEYRHLVSVVKAAQKVKVGHFLSDE